MGTVFGSMPIVSGIVGVAVFLLLLWAGWVSRGEGESQATVRLGLMGILLLFPFLLPLFLPQSAGAAVASILVFLTVFGMVCVMVPFGRMGLQTLGTPEPGVDERDIMFSRAALAPGTDRFEEYYRTCPQYREPDEKFRSEPGLLSPGSAHYHREGFAAADAAFWTIEMLRPFVEGEETGTDGYLDSDPAQGVKLGGEASGAGAVKRVERDPEAMSRFLKGWTLKMGAHSAGVAELKDYHFYTHVGRGPDYGMPVDVDHTYAIALTVEMDKEMVDRAPRSPTAMESAFQYLRGGAMAVQLADLIRRLGYQARAHVDGNYRVICPLVARDAGLGEFGRMGLLMTPKLGPRVRIAVVTTDLPLASDGPRPDPSTVDFCSRCKKCADSCPSRAISFDPPLEDEKGVLRWRIDSEACFTLWGRLGTDCARCMAVCPYSHPDNSMHSFVRWGIRNNGLFRKGALFMDDLVYGRRPRPKGDLGWMDLPESEEGLGRSSL